MEEYRIGPWDHLEGTVDPGIVLEQYVPPELEAIAWKVAELYEMKVSDMTLVTSKPDKGGAIWKMNTDRGPRSIKVLHREPKRSLFSVGSQEYLVNQGARVPSLIRTKDDRLYVEAGGKLWIVTEWIESLVQASKIDLEGAAQLCTGLGEFHKLSQGYVPPFGAARSTRLRDGRNITRKLLPKSAGFEISPKRTRNCPPAPGCCQSLTITTGRPGRFMRSLNCRPIPGWQPWAIPIGAWPTRITVGQTADGSWRDLDYRLGRRGV